MNDTSKQSIIATYLRFCERAAQEAITEAGTKNMRVARTAARCAALNTLPPLTTPENTQAYIACVAWMASQQLLTPKDASRLLYAAQVAMTNRANCIPAVL
jgi:hypothetical protein